jgi:hypothetical protein
MYASSIHWKLQNIDDKSTEHLNDGKTFQFGGQKTQYCSGVRSPEISLETQCNISENHRRLLKQELSGWFWNSYEAEMKFLEKVKVIWKRLED